MVGNLTTALRAAQSGLLTTQNAVTTSANNISNVNTEGYSRKIINFEQRVLAGAGAGVQLAEFTRAVDEGLLKDLRRETSQLQKLESQVIYYERLQVQFGTPEANNSISHIVNQFSQAAESLAVSPEKALDLNEFVRYANEVSLKLKAMTEEIQALRVQADQELERTVAEVNDLTGQIAEANDLIIRNQAVNNDVTSLLDQRDLALTKLSELVDITYFPRSDGDLVVFGSDGFSLVDRTANTVTHTAVGSLSSTSTFAEGDLNGIYVGDIAPDNEITNEIKGGKLAGLIQQRDDILPGLQAQIDELASKMKEAVNQVHNRGTSFPGLQSFEGSRSFIDADDQTITLDSTNSTADVTIALFNNSGEEQASTTLNTIMTNGAFGTGVQASRGPWSITEVAASIEDWLRANGAASATVQIDSNSRKLEIEVNNTNLSLAFRDETATADGSSASDAEIGFDSDGDGDIDETVYGFSNFFGLNDLFTDGADGTLYDTNILSNSFSASASTLTFYDRINGVGSGNELGSIDIPQLASLEDIAELVNDGDFGVTASVIPDGSGSRLRIQSDSGRELVITEGSSDTIIDDIGLGISDARSATTLSVRDDILAEPQLTSTAATQYNSETGEYYISSGDNTTIQQIADTLRGVQDFAAAGGLTIQSRTFEDYASAILARNADLADTNTVQIASEVSIVENLELNASRISGVSLDEEMSNLILFQQAFSASARVVSVIQEMFETLDQAVS
ncbi:MAG: flagellar hook-associated protein FlgK [Rhodospirillales bacterium]